MNFISVIAPTEEVARAQATALSGYASDSISEAHIVAEVHNNSRQDAYIFETSHDVTKHPLYARALLSEVFDLCGEGVSDGPILQFGPEVTVGG